MPKGWANIVAGKSGIATITKFDASAFACHFAGEVKGFNVEDYIPGKDARHMDTFIHFGVAAAMQAIKDAGLPTGDQLSEQEGDRIGVLIGAGIGGLPEIETHADRIREPRPAPHLAVLRAGLDHQHDLGPRVDLLRLPRARTWAS